MNSRYQEMLESLKRKSYSASLTIGVVGLFLISFLLLAAAGICGFLQPNNQNILPIFVVLLAGGALGFFGSLIWYLMKSREYVRMESIELDMKYPGFYDYYQQRQAKLDEITTSSN